jgi:hypothetical protein
MRVEHDYDRGGAMGRCARRKGKAACGRLVARATQQEPYRSARQVFRVVDNGSSHRGEKLTTPGHPPCSRRRHDPTSIVPRVAIASQVAGRPAPPAAGRAGWPGLSHPPGR